MNISPYFLEHHVQQQVERISQDRIDAEMILVSSRPAPLSGFRARLGSALIAAGERLGGSHVETVRTEPRPAGSFSLGF